jgi:hypothetical protein
LFVRAIKPAMTVEDFLRGGMSQLGAQGGDAGGEIGSGLVDGVSDERASARRHLAQLVEIDDADR